MIQGRAQLMARGAKLASALACIALVASCASAQQQREQRAARSATAFLERQGSIGDPGRVAAADFAFARMARDEGNWTAFRHYAAPDAVMNAQGGWAPANGVLAGLEDPPEPIRWAPTRVWSSCDGRLAATLGRFLRPDGIVGSYITIWKLQPDNEYRWIYDTGTPDDPQPAPLEREEIPDDAIVVPGLTAIEGYVADCPDPQAAVPAPQPMVFNAGTEGHSQISDDGTLRFSRLLAADGSREVIVDWYREGAWQEAVKLEIPASLAQ